MNIRSHHRRVVVSLELAGALAAEHDFGRRQTPDFASLAAIGQAPFRISLREYDFGAAPSPRLHSHAAGNFDGTRVLVADRTNGVRDLNQSGQDRFPVESLNRDVLGVDPVAKQPWHRSSGSPARPADGLVSELTRAIASPPANNQFAHAGNALALARGYLLNAEGEFTTADRLTVLDLPGIAKCSTSRPGTIHAVMCGQNFRPADSRPGQRVADDPTRETRGFHV